LEERHRLTERVSILEQSLIEKDNEYKLLARRLQLETKNSRTHLLHEASKFREISNKLEKANAEIKRLNDLVEVISALVKAWFFTNFLIFFI
jgi:hypothetical protein